MPGPEEVKFDEVLGEAAYARILPWLKGLEDDRLEPVKLPLDGCAQMGIALAGRIAAPEVDAGLKLMPTELWDPGPRERLLDLSWATWHVTVEAARRRAQKSDRKVPRELAEEAREVRDRMLELVEYQFKGHELVEVEAADIRKGTGYRDRARDLTRLAALYRDPAHAAQIAGDSRNFRDTDEAEARRLARAIIEKLGEDEAPYWSEMEARAWTRLSVDYHEVTRLLGFVYYHKDPHKLRDTPSLFGALRAPSPGRKGRGGSEGGEGSGEGDGSGVDGAPSEG